MIPLPFRFEGLEESTIGSLSFEVFVVFLHLCDTSMLLHHFLKVTPALGGGS